MNFIAIGILSAIVISFLSGIRIVRPTERAVIETLGKYARYGKPGFNWIIPIFQKMIQINITEQMSAIERQVMITEDKLNCNVDLVVFFKVKPDEQNIKNALYNVDDVEEQLETLAQTTARNVIGGMPFKDVNSERNTLNSKLANIMKIETKSWGVEIIRVELKEIIPPQKVQEVMNQVIIAENEKRAAIDFATAKETEADGLKRSKIKEAEGIKEYSIRVAEGKAKAFELIDKSFKGNAILNKKLEVTEASLKDNSKLIITKDGINPNLILGELFDKKNKYR